MTNQELFALVRKNLLGTGCAVLSIALGGWTYYRSGDGPDYENEVTQKSAEAERYASNLKNAAQLQENLEAIAAANKAIDARIIRASQFSNNLAYFYQLESETGVKLTSDPRLSAPLAKKDPKAAYVSIPCGLSVQGTLPQLLTFLRRLENGIHYCRVMNASLVGSTDRTLPLNLTINLELLGLP
jgi:type II secretory pathway pseudopilin PulG